MNKKSDEGHENLNAELAALATRVHELEARQNNSKPATNSARRRGFSRGLVFGLLPLVVGILFFATVLYGQNPDILALFINEKGHVGIGNTAPSQPLDVTGLALFRDGIVVGKNATVSGDLTTKKRLRVDGEATFKRHVNMLAGRVAGNLKVGGDLTVRRNIKGGGMITGGFVITTKRNNNKNVPDGCDKWGAAICNRPAGTGKCGVGSSKRRISHGVCKLNGQNMNGYCLSFICLQN